MASTPDYKPCPESWESRISKHITTDGAVILDARIARWLEDKVGITPEWRSGLRDTDPVAYVNLMALHLAPRWRSAIGTNSVVALADRAPSAMWLSTSEAADEMQVSPRCITKWINSGRLPAIKTGARWLINRNDLHIHDMTA